MSDGSGFGWWFRQRNHGGARCGALLLADDNGGGSGFIVMTNSFWFWFELQVKRVCLFCCFGSQLSLGSRSYSSGFYFNPVQVRFDRSTLVKLWVRVSAEGQFWSTASQLGQLGRETR
ncbi:hypothetical protein Hanom_Chr17g01586981 [Helianthus anomalus]